MTLNGVTALSLRLLTFPVYPLSSDQALYQILSKSSKPRQSYDLNTANLATVRHLEFDRRWILRISLLLRTTIFV